MKTFLYIAAALHYLIAAFMLAGAVLEHSELHFIAFGAFASCGTVAAMWASILGRLSPHRTAAGT
jgi:hypothetical protein